MLVKTAICDEKKALVTSNVRSVMRTDVGKIVSYETEC
jgi:hypothetical protein